VFAYPFHFGKSGFSAYFFTPNPDIRILSGFFLCRTAQAPIYCLGVVSDTGDVGLLMKIKIAVMTVMSIRLRDGIMCFRLQIHSRWMTKTHWRAQSQRSHPGGPTPRTKQEDSGQDWSHYTNEYTEALHSSTTWVRRNGARHSTALDNHQLLIPSFSAMNCSLAVSPIWPQKTYLSQVSFVVVTTTVYTHHVHVDRKWSK